MGWKENHIVICSNKFFLILLSLFAGIQLFAAPPVPFSGKLAINGKNFHGNALFSFSIVDSEGAVHWKHAEEPDSIIENFVMNGRYLVLLGGQGMQTLPADLFLQHESLFLRVSVDLKDGQGIRLLEPDQRITSSPYALSAEIARLAERAQVAGGVDAGAINAEMLEQALLADLNRTSEIGEITREMLPQDVQDDLNRIITRDRLSEDIIADLNRTVRLQDLSAEVSQSINRPITREMLPQGVRDELNATITLERLSADVRADLNRTIGIANLSTEVTDKLNQTFSIDPGSITLDQLSQQVRDDINRTITKSMLSQEVLDELNASGGVSGSVPGSLIAVPFNQNAPSGYELYQWGNPKELVWEEKAPVSVARHAYDGIEVLDGKIYFVGGKDGSSAKNIAERYDPTTNTWETLANMSVAREGVACAVLNGKLYAIGGVGLSSLEVFDPSNDSWSAGVALPSEVKYGTAITVDGKIYLIGGQNASSQETNQVLCFDPLTSQWTTKANMPTARRALKLVWFESRIWAISGASSGALRHVESYDPSTDTWLSEALLIRGRSWLVAWVAKGRIYAGGGYQGSFLSSIEVYDPMTKQWVGAGNFPENRYAADTVVLNDKVYVVGGATASDIYSNKVFAADLNASVEGVHDLYYKTGDASTGTPTVQAEVADGSIGPSKLSSEVSNALKPVVVGQPSSVVEHAGMPTYLAVDATGGDNTYQWKKDGVDIAGATGSVLSITDLNASQHEGIYTVVVSNAFGSVTSSVAQIDVNGSLTEGLVGWWKFDETEGNIAYDSSGNDRDGNFSAGGNWANGKLGGALDLNGSTSVQILDYKGVVGTSARSVSCWFKTNSEGYPRIFNWGGLNLEGVPNFFTCAITTLGGPHNSDYGTLKLALSSGFKVGTQKVNTDNWFHLAVVASENSNVTEAKFFLNFSEDSALMTASKMINTASDIDVTFGGDLDGLIDDIRIYDRALSALEVKALYELGEQPVQESGSGTTTVVNGTVADGSITTNQLSEQILKYLKPEITQQPTTAGTIYADTNHTLSVSAEGKYLTYQWKKNGVNLAGETNATLTITDANATQHDGNYSVVVSNDFGSVESNVALTDIWMVGENIANLVLWLDASREDSFVLNNSIIENWRDLSGNRNDMNITDGNASLTGILNGRSVAYYDGDDITATTKNFSNELDQSGYSIVALSRYAGTPSLRVISSGYVSGSRNWLLGHHDGISSKFFAEGWVYGGNTGDLNWHIFATTHEPAISFNNNVAPLSSFWQNGAAKILNSGLSSDTSPAPADIIFGGALSSEKSECEVAEFIMIGAEFSDSDRQKLEGYIAHKWGLSAILPNSHPYKN